VKNKVQQEPDMPNASPRSSFRFAAIVLLPAFLAGCATATNPRDPLEPFNRGVYEFNETFDKYLMKPVAQGYTFILPQPVRNYVGNFFSNINDVQIMANNVLQGKFLNALDDFGRIAINTSIGIVGLLDIATEAGLRKNNEDFGQTLAVWGVAQGPFIMLPFFGPSTGRDAVGRVGNAFIDPLWYVNPESLSWQLWGLRAVDYRAQLLDASKVLDAAALDRYDFLRDAYLQQRRNLIYDGKPPLDKDMDIAPPKGQKSEAETRDRVAATPPAENLMAASEDHMAQTVRPVESVLAASPAHVITQNEPAVERVNLASPGPLFESDGAQPTRSAKTPASQAAGSGPSTLMRVWRYFEPRETPAFPTEGS
jgi:phospholipid-binding lipoprotein MlaA